jgi:hypothetical protein
LLSKRPHEYGVRETGERVEPLSSQEWCGRLIFKTARRWRWVSENPLELVELPPLDQAETETLTPAEVRRLFTVYREKAVSAPDEERLLGLRWIDVEMRAAAARPAGVRAR